ncbi:amino acid adenylation domain-containing protein [Nocardia halotolerans]|uniref:Amino acid adenylation domain-containing protein n=1 Tax=Nocardia halotolerans TaxID=1755878 RepID=A0ABV8VK10_9NOCA
MLTVRPDSVAQQTHPLTRAQSSWWLAQQLYPAVPATVALYLDLHGRLDVDLVTRTARQAARELESPQLRFRLVDGVARQYVDDAAHMPFTVVDLTAEPDPVATALDRMERDHSTPLDPLGDDLTVAVVFAVTPHRHLLYLRSHHMVLDGVGAAAVLRRTAELYRAQLPPAATGDDNRAPAHRALTVTDILEDEAAYWNSPRADKDREYWAEQVAGLNEPVSLAGAPTLPSPRTHHVAGTLDASTARLLSASKGRHGATFPELAIAAFACYLARVSGSSDLTLTLPVTARATAALRQSAGSMSNAVPLRLTNLQAGTVGEVVTQVRCAVIRALRHQRYRHEEMGAGPEAVFGGYGPVVNLLGMVEPLRLGPVTGQARLLALGPVPDLQINGYQFGRDENSVSIDFQANPARYRRETVVWHHRMFLGYFARFLAAAPTAPIRSLDEVRTAPVAVPGGADVRLLPDLLDGNRAPDAVALSYQGRTLTYRELDEASSRWARELLAGGAGPGDFVVVAIPRSLESVLAFWAVAKTGACFVPVDPADPPHRVTTIIADSGARRGLTIGSVRDELSRGGSEALDLHWLLMDDPQTAAQRASTPVGDSDRARPLSPAHPAYAIYTSGTTGRPKGVVLNHRGVAPLIDYLLEHYGLDQHSVLLHSHTNTFDAHLLEVLGAAAACARLVVAPVSIVAGPEFAQLVRDNGCTVVQTAPAVLATLSPALVPQVRVVAIGGEACPERLVRDWAPHVRLYNGYGPTEATVMVTETPALAAEEPVSIGTALPSVLAVVLDTRLTRVPSGARGELYLGGSGIAEGYLRDPGGTATRFIADPFHPGRRLYRTGDLVTEREDGAYAFIARTDDQVEVHGRRIEPAEIENVLMSRSEIAYAVVRVADQGRPGARLIGYVVAAEGIRFDAAATMGHLRSHLPPSLVPSALVELDRVPVAGNGKVDRGALPAPALDARSYREPHTAVQRLVADRVAATLGLSRAGLDDDFFALGGNSLLGARLSAALAEDTGVPVAVRWLYTDPTVVALAHRITTYDPTAGESDEALGVLLPLRRGGTRAPLFCVHSAVPLAWCYAGLARHVRDRPVYGLQAPVLTAGAQVPDTIDGLADHYIEAMLGVQPDGPYHLLGWSLGGQIAHAVAVRLQARGATVGAVVMLDSVVVPADLAPPRPPRMRDLLTHLLGDEPDDADAIPDVTAAEAAAELATAGAAYGVGLSADQLTRLHRGYVAGVALSHGYRPGVYDGDLLYFSANRGITEYLGADMWRPYVTGRLIEHPVAATHAQLTNTDVLADIGPVLARHLDGEVEPIMIPESRIPSTLSAH